MSLLRNNFQPTDFADADCRVTEWNKFDGYNGVNGYRIWVCKCGGGYWFQRHEWTREGRNSSEMDDWIFSSYSPYRKWGGHYLPAPKDDI
jgi:hypothetical protein